MIDTEGNLVIPGDPKHRHFWKVCSHYHEKCPWALGIKGECDLEYNRIHLIDLAGREPHCPFRYREQI